MNHSPVTIFYFGCWSKTDIGHFLYQTNGIRVTRDMQLKLPPPLRQIDGFLPSSAPQSKVVLRHINDWTIISMGDYSADTRGGSNASFLAQGTFSFEEILKLAQTHFPSQFARINSSAPIQI